jgi:beta-N-acetylhexosaminidase
MDDTTSLSEKIGQLLMFGFDGLVVPESFADLIQNHHLGNVILFSRNVASYDQCSALTTTLQRLAHESGQPYPLIIAADQENGVVRRLPSDVPGLPGNMALGATHQPDNARQSAAITADLLTRVGINMNLAPVLDVNNNPANPVIGVRSFGDLAEVVAEFGAAFVDGLQSHGVIACGKHFPGHGDTEVDSHRDLPVIRHARDRLDHLELVPFQAAIRRQIDAIMTAHVVFPAVEPNFVPATLSYRVLTRLLRHELGFSGLIITDCLEMNAISETVGVGRGAVEALKAGADMVMVSHRIDRQLTALYAIREAVASGELSQSRIDDAYRRVIQLKQKRLRGKPTAHRPWPIVLQEAAHLQEVLAPQAVTWLRHSSTLPTHAEEVKSVAVLIDDRTPTMMAAGPGATNSFLTEAIHVVMPNATVTEYHFPDTQHRLSLEALISQLRGYHLVLITVNGPSNDYWAIVNRVATEVPHSVVLLLRSPYDVVHLADAPCAVLALYENTPWMAVASLRALFGGTAHGRLPVYVNEQYPRGFRAPLSV